MKHFIITLLFILAINISVSATTVRGLVRGTNNYGYFYPLFGIQVELLVWNGQFWVSTLSVYTGQDGMYYFYNIIPGYYYYVRVNRQYNYQIYIGPAEIYFKDVAIVTL